MASLDAPDWQMVVTTVKAAGDVPDAPDWQRIVVNPGAAPVGFNGDFSGTTGISLVDDSATGITLQENYTGFGGGIELLDYDEYGINISSYNVNGGVLLWQEEQAGASANQVRVLPDELDLYTSGTSTTVVRSVGAGVQICSQNTQKLAFYGTTPIAQPTVTGSKGGNAALTSLMTALANLGLVINSTS